ncbi:MAG: hypothetical protein ACYCO0_01760 [Candidatus Micrarchaeaceae archaeon]
MVSILNRLFGKKKSGTNITVTSVNLKFMGNSHAIDGMHVSEAEFDIDIPFQNKMGSGLLPDNMKGPKMVVSAITVADPFKLIDISPKLPVEVGFLSKVIFKVRIGAPNRTYEGPLSINFSNEASNNVTISLKKVTLHYKDREVELEDSGVTSAMQKSQLFREKVQLYKIVSLGDVVNSIEVSKPFEIVSTDPKLPLKADRKDSYIVSLYMKCPDFSYAGDLDITFL